MSVLAPLLLLLPVSAPAAPAARVTRGNLEVVVKVSGTVVPDDVFRVKSIIDGRVERVQASTFTWLKGEEPFALLANKELAAIIDAKGSQNQDVLENRWQRMYALTPVRCDETCFVLKSFVTEGAWVKPQAVLLEAAGKLRLVGRVRPEDVRWVRDGQELSFWATSDPKKRLKGRIARFVLDVQGLKVEPAGTFTLFLSPDRFLPPGTEWEGELRPLKKPNVLQVPTAALIKAADGSYYLPVKVSPGVITDEVAEVNGVEERREVLVLEDPRVSSGSCVARARPETEFAELKAICERAATAQAAPPPTVVRPPPSRGERDAEPHTPEPRPSRPASGRSEAPPSRPAEPKRAHADVLPTPEEPEDPYGEP